MKTHLNILSIGNSFSQDAAAKLHDIALSCGVTINITNLYIGGCSLEMHWENIIKDADAYAYELNGQDINKKISIKNALIEKPWDYLTLQQLSSLSINYTTYFPFLKKLSDYVKAYAPTAEQLIHETWAYEDGSKRLVEELGYSVPSLMYLDLKKAYLRAADELGELRIIPSGTAFQTAIASGFKDLYRDTFHASLEAGRYLLGAVWFETFTQKSIFETTYIPLGISRDELMVLRRAAHSAVNARSAKTD